MVTFLRPHPHAHGPTAIVNDVRRLRFHRHSSSLLTCTLSLRRTSMASSHPHRQSEEDSATDNSTQQQQAPTPSPPRQQEPSISSSSSGGGGETSSWLQLGVGTAPSRRKRRRSEYEGDPGRPSTSSVPPPELGLSLQFPSAAAVVAAAGAPPSHEAGTWFVLRAAAAADNNNQREPPLPQIPRSYLRVRDGRMTVRVVMRYLVNKLGLQEDSQLEITCRGQHLLPAMTLQHVRDTIWRPSPAEAAAVLPAPGSSSTNQVMTLHYSRS